MNKNVNTVQDRIRGSLVGGAIGDALGYRVEFLSYEDIIRKYGKGGITEYDIARVSGKALISDDTQMTLFTAAGILESEADSRNAGGTRELQYCIAESYLCWLTTQWCTYDEYCRDADGTKYTAQRLMEIPELFSRRAPGNTCLSALRTQKNGGINEHPLRDRINDSKGCGGIMRTAPVALCRKGNPITDIDIEGAIASAITHGHSLGFMTSAVMAHIINRIVYPEGGLSNLRDIIEEAEQTVCGLFRDDAHIDELREIIDRSVSLVYNSDSDEQNIRKIGEGWVAEETLGIAIYCSLRYEHDFSGGIIASVNHDGDSDSTGAVTGNILGALHGYSAIEEKWKERLELHDTIVAIADRMNNIE